MKTRFRTTWRGRLVLQVEETICWNSSYDEDGERIPAGSRTGWRDAKLSDFPDGISLRPQA